MGRRSAGKWFKSVLFGKKHSPSNLSKNIKKTPEKAQEEDLTKNSANDTVFSSPLDQGVDSQCNNVRHPVIHNERSIQERAATKAQAAFRGYLARRAFRALKGIIRLQALIRGRLVRRQAVATFRCALAIVKFQALVRKEHTGANLFLLSKGITTNTFVRKILVKLPTAMPLSLQYDLSEPNSAWNWLERWSISRFWQMLSKIERVTMTKPQKNHGGVQVFESVVGKSRTNRKFSNVANGANSGLVSLEVEKSKYDPRKGADELEEQPQNELERVKRNLRKISASAAAAFEKSVMKTQKVQALQNAEKPNNSASPQGSEQENLVSAEKLGHSDLLTDKLDLLEDPLIHSLEDGLNMESLLALDDELNSKEQSDNDNHKIQKRRSLPASKNSRSLPSYMAATESAKAKLRPQGSPKFYEGTEYNNIGRRHSLPASTNGTWSSLSPRMQKHVQANGKGVNRLKKSLMTSQYGKAFQPGWRR